MKSLAKSYGCDAEADITELPHAFRTTLATIPPFLPELIAERQHQTCDRIRVGLAWTAGRWKPERSIPIGRLTALGDITRHIVRQPAARGGIRPLARGARRPADDR